MTQASPYAFPTCYRGGLILKQLGMGLGEGGARPRVTEHEVGLDLFTRFIGFTARGNKRSSFLPPPLAFKAEVRAYF